MDGDVMYKTDLKCAIGLVIGSEGEGVGRNIKEKCDFVVQIPMYGEISSLNASVAASLMMYEVVRQRNF
jgi:23S rRNA (guanosine2251-2'-O)-methyltransferase